MCQLSRMQIQLLTFPGCANAAAARELLSRVLEASGSDAVFEEWDTHAEATPAAFRGYASPTILVDGVAIGGAELPGDCCCRLYLDEEGRRLVGLPSESALRSALVRPEPSPHAVAT